jgi:hypothetical protein
MKSSVLYDCPDILLRTAGTGATAGSPSTARKRFCLNSSAFPFLDKMEKLKLTRKGQLKSITAIFRRNSLK